jgi:hypothetical protein
LAKGGAARTELESKLSGDMMLAFKQMVPAFDNTLKEALAAGKTKQEATALAVEAFDRSITGADKKTRSYAENLEAATKRLKEDPALQLQKAMNKLQEVMTSPKALESIKKLMDVLPPLAEKMAQLLGIIIDNPLLSAGAAVGGRLGMSMVGGMASRAIFGGGGFGGVPSGGGAVAPSTGGLSYEKMGMTAAKMTMQGNGKMIITPGTGWPMVPPDSNKMKMTGSQIAGGFANAVAAAGVGIAIGTAAAIAMQAGADKTQEVSNQLIKKLDKLGFDIANVSGPPKTAEEALKAVRLHKRVMGAAKYEAERYSGVGGKIDLGQALLGTIFGGENPLEIQNKAMTELVKLQKELVSNTRPTAGSAGSRGPKTKPSPVPGAEPKK